MPENPVIFKNYDEKLCCSAEKKLGKSVSGCIIARCARTIDCFFELP
jgi:hypothetical protein